MNVSELTPALVSKALYARDNTETVYTSITRLGLDYWEFVRWLNTKEGYDAQQQAQQNLEQALDVALTNIVHKTTDHLLDKLEHGELHTLKNGETSYRKLRAETVAKILNIAFDKRQLIRNKPTNIEQVTESQEQLQERLRDIGRQSRPVLIHQSD